MTADSNNDNRERAEEFFEYITSYLEELDEFDVDETQDGILIKSPRGNYLLNYHGVTKQIWVASPLSGAHHFDYSPTSAIETPPNEQAAAEGKEGNWQTVWVCSRTQKTIQESIIKELLPHNKGLE